MKSLFLYIISFEPHNNMQSKISITPKKWNDISCLGQKEFWPKRIHLWGLCPYQYRKGPGWDKVRSVGSGWNAEEGTWHRCESHMLEYKNREDWCSRGMGIQEADCHSCILAIAFCTCIIWVKWFKLPKPHLIFYQAGVILLITTSELLWE